jgi:hypothetical protein
MSTFLIELVRSHIHGICVAVPVNLEERHEPVMLQLYVVASKSSGFISKRRSSGNTTGYKMLV